MTLPRIIHGPHMQQTIDLEPLPAAGAAVNPKTQAAVKAAVHVRMINLEPLSGRCDGHRH